MNIESVEIWKFYLFLCHLWTLVLLCSCLVANVWAWILWIVFDNQLRSLASWRGLSRIVELQHLIRVTATRNPPESKREVLLVECRILVEQR